MLETPSCPICSGQTAPMPKHPEAALYRCSDCRHAFSLPASIAAPETYGSEYFQRVHRRWFEHPNIELFARILKYIPQGATVLDVGCGNGDFLRFARRSRSDLALTGIDLSENRPEQGIRFIREELLAWKTEEKFSAIVSLAVIEHLADAAAFVRRIHHLATPDATIAVMTLNDTSILYASARLGRALGVPLAFDRLYSKHHLHHFTPASLRRLLQQGGLSVAAQFSHAAPIHAMDIPTASRIADGILRAGLSCIWLAGYVTGRGYLQTAICRPE
jgi:2-polyprenyl-3-methyl-5-hydroxy-6-metoxy-1,4-benzoquinol methylase